MTVSSPSVVMLTADRQIDRRILQEAQSLRARGWQVTLIAMPEDAPAPLPAGLDVIRVGAGNTGTPSRESFILDAYRVIRSLLPMNGRLMRFAKQVAWSYVVDQEQFYQRLYGASALQFRPTVFVAHDLPMLAVAHRAAHACGARLVYDSHELFAEQEFSNSERKRWRHIEGQHIGACDAVITVNPSIARELETRYELENPVNVIYNAAYLESPSPAKGKLRRQLGLPDDARILLMQGGLSAGRNIDTLVRAMAKVKTQDVHLVLLGDGQITRYLKRMVRSLHLENRVYFHPAVPQHALPEYTIDADLGVIPYLASCLNNRYCTPNKLFEYVAAELPMLASDLPEISRIVNEFNLGLTTDFGSEASIAQGIDNCFAKSDRLVQWRQNAARARNQLCWEQEERKLISIFEAFR
ncbi:MULTISPECIES: glycosyltransferase family 4 protein [Achromobacter]|uniref:Glycosyltransferase family 4 protein n=1 Tax=Achromobacter spanius TaxID=217203 RepID=A0ABY8GNK0_9BURK|nr:MULTISPECIES: glycosyltransferase family 4 protein [Achromobacter]WAI84353.1 glycosyltransferase family 4 protein [Achromobacter spanius]WEX94436.1 glycosyltransferase family 4 protein [Achromobacter sp. SS2-2022]WFP06400.1 glycosyltransferase family 4 protein [Achromobacter spanius]